MKINVNLVDIKKEFYPQWLEEKTVVTFEIDDDTLNLEGLLEKDTRGLILRVIPKEYSVRYSNKIEMKLEEKSNG